MSLFSFVPSNSILVIPSLSFSQTIHFNALTSLPTSQKHSDVASTVGPAVKEYLSRPFVSKLLSDARATGDETIIETCNWAGAVVQQALQ